MFFKNERNVGGAIFSILIVILSKDEDKNVLFKIKTMKNYEIL